jgi:hypothetical protein
MSLNKFFWPKIFTTNTVYVNVYKIYECDKNQCYEKLCPWQLDYPISRAPKQIIYNCIAIVLGKYDKLINKMACKKIKG